MTSEITDWEWLSLNQDKWTCWEKAHKYYIPQGLFKSCRNGPINIDNYEDYAGLCRIMQDLTLVHLHIYSGRLR